MKYIKVSDLNLNQNRLNSLKNIEKCEQLKILRIEENCLSTEAFTREFLENSKVSLIAFGGNLFQEKDFQELSGYEEYQKRFTAAKIKM